MMAAQHNPPGLSLIEEEYWYTGPISERKAEEILCRRGKLGDFLVRDSLLPDADFVLSVNSGKEIWHYDVNVQPNNSCIFNSYSFINLPAAIGFYTENRLGPVFLKEPKEPVVTDAELSQHIGPVIQVAPTSAPPRSRPINVVHLDSTYATIGPPFESKPTSDPKPSGRQNSGTYGGSYIGSGNPKSSHSQQGSEHFVIDTNPPLSGASSTTHACVSPSKIESVYVSASEIDTTELLDHTYADPHCNDTTLLEEVKDKEGAQICETTFDDHDTISTVVAITDNVSLSGWGPETVQHTPTEKGELYAVVSKERSTAGPDESISQPNATLSPQVENGKPEGLPIATSTLKSGSTTSLPHKSSVPTGPSILKLPDDLKAEQMAELKRLPSIVQKRLELERKMKGEEVEDTVAEASSTAEVKLGLPSAEEKREEVARPKLEIPSAEEKREEVARPKLEIPSAEEKREEVARPKLEIPSAEEKREEVARPKLEIPSAEEKREEVERPKAGVRRLPSVKQKRLELEKKMQGELEEVQSPQAELKQQLPSVQQKRTELERRMRGEDVESPTEELPSMKQEIENPVPEMKQLPSIEQKRLEVERRIRGEEVESPRSELKQEKQQELPSIGQKQLELERRARGEEVRSPQKPPPTPRRLSIPDAVLALQPLQTRPVSPPMTTHPGLTKEEESQPQPKPKRKTSWLRRRDSKKEKKERKTSAAIQEEEKVQPSNAELNPPASEKRRSFVGVAMPISPTQMDIGDPELKTIFKNITKNDWKTNGNGQDLSAPTLTPIPVTVPNPATRTRNVTTSSTTATVLPVYNIAPSMPTADGYGTSQPATLEQVIPGLIQTIPHTQSEPVLSQRHVIPTGHTTPTGHITPTGYTTPTGYVTPSGTLERRISTPILEKRAALINRKISESAEPVTMGPMNTKRSGTFNKRKSFRKKKTN